MVCQETYNDQNNNWLSPDEVISEDGKNYYNKNKPSEKIFVGPTESMSKSKKNTIDPEEIIKSYGADAVRLFILSDSPPEKDVQWSEQGMNASYKFVQKFWALHQKIITKTKSKSNIANEDLEELTNQIINKLTISLTKFSYNVIVANLHEIYHYLIHLMAAQQKSLNLVDKYMHILKVIMQKIIK